MNAQDLVATLKTQHQALADDLFLVLENSQTKESLASGKVLFYMDKFKTDLVEHTKVEQELLYSDYINKKINKGDDIVGTKKFIREMEELSVVVMNFLEKYTSMDLIAENYPAFKMELAEVASALTMRIETEEDGVFDFYLST